MLVLSEGSFINNNSVTVSNRDKPTPEPTHFSIQCMCCSPHNSDPYSNKVDIFESKTLKKVFIGAYENSLKDANM